MFVLQGAVAAGGRRLNATISTAPALMRRSQVMLSDITANRSGWSRISRACSHDVDGCGTYFLRHDASPMLSCSARTPPPASAYPADPQQSAHRTHRAQLHREAKAMVIGSALGEQVPIGVIEVEEPLDLASNGVCVTG